MDLKGKKALIFGVANQKSIAYSIAKKLKEHGVELGFTYAGEQLQRRVEPLSEELGGAFCVKCDVTDDADIEKTFKTVSEKFGHIDILVHAVAYAPADDLKGRFVDTSREGFKTAMEISVFSLVNLAKHAEPFMSEGSTIITMTYYGSEKVVKNYNVMGVAKAALESSVRYLANELGEKGIRVNAISAGPIKTLAASGISGFKTILACIEEKSPLRRNITGDDVANTSLYLCSELSSGVTGEVIYVDSGYNILGI
ncbi:Enoyl-(acyl-carrier-protein) reductase (NADH) [Flexistipes sinusarabici DSM 4947]|uniref:Enoyl-[acyl-carrier-protein] reductase [NADH] n=4 Tax=Flexistipes sinusarabici TaxID=2352 RepID=F8E5T5_FLESM|nr:enoyl-ACP reductase [Flexistipes sinusarabici]AEI15776.1 Enoyl-(acyl-carrier-protein) reductase (NADH) [Flexistipes sinusarabici DSM 4947]